MDAAKRVRERTRGSKWEGQFRKKAGKVIKETAHTITFLPEGGRKEVTYTGRGEDKASEEKCEPRTENQAGTGRITKRKKMKRSRGLMQSKPKLRKWQFLKKCRRTGKMQPHSKKPYREK